jgi:hypothetical protein
VEDGSEEARQGASQARRAETRAEEDPRRYRMDIRGRNRVDWMTLQHKWFLVSSSQSIRVQAKED